MASARNIFGFAHTHVGKIVAACEGVLGRDKVQVLHERDRPANRRCYIVVGVNSLDTARKHELNRCRATLVVVDALPALHRVDGLHILDADNSSWWSPNRPKFGPMLRSIRAEPQPLKIVVSDDKFLSNLILEVRSRGVLDAILGMAKALKPEERPFLHECVARYMIGRISLSLLMKKAVIGRGIPAKIEAAAFEALHSDRAKRLGEALLEYLEGGDAALIAVQRNVDAFEIRFLATHVKGAKDGWNTGTKDRDGKAGLVSSTRRSAARHTETTHPVVRLEPIRLRSGNGGARKVPKGTKLPHRRPK